VSQLGCLRPMLSTAVTIIGLLVMAVLLARAIQGGFLSQLPFFYSYLGFVLLRAVVSLGFLWFLPQYHASVFWFCFLFEQIAEFAVLLEVSDHIFKRYAAIRSLGRLLVGLVCGVFLVFYILPSLAGSVPANRVILDLVKKTSLTKAVIILILFVAVRFYKLPLGRSISGVLLGFSIYLGANVANFALAEKLGPALYAPVFRIVGPLSWTLGSLVWVIALWRYEPAAQVSRGRLAPEGDVSTPVYALLGRLNDTLLRLLQK
jgi:hypothetical protein